MPPSANTLLNRFVVKAKFRHLQVLVKLAEVGSMRRTATAVNMTQPAISQLVAELERLLETDLFFRHAKGVEPTQATKELLPVAYRILGALEDGAENIANRLNQQGGVVQVSASPAAIGGMIQGKLDGFAKKHPSIQVHINQMNDSDPLSGIVEQSMDMVCTREPLVVPKGWKFERCVEDMLVVVCSAKHDLANAADSKVSDLGEEKWLLNRVGSIARQRFEEISERNNWPADCRCQMIMHIPDLTKEMLLTGNYLAILPKSVARPWLGRGEIVELVTEVNAPLKPLGYLISNEAPGAAATTFAKYLKQSLSVGAAEPRSIAAPTFPGPS